MAKTSSGALEHELADRALGLATKAGEKIQGALHSAEKTAEQIAEQSRDAGERVTKVAGNFQSALNKSVREQPMATMAVIAAFGFVLGALWKS